MHTNTSRATHKPKTMGPTLAAWNSQIPGPTSLGGGGVERLPACTRNHCSQTSHTCSCTPCLSSFSTWIRIRANFSS